MAGSVRAPVELELVLVKGVVLKDGVGWVAGERPAQVEVAANFALGDGEDAEVVGKRVDVLSAAGREELVLLGESGAGEAVGEEWFSGVHCFFEE